MNFFMKVKHIIFEKADCDMFMHFFKQLEEVQNKLRNIVVLNHNETIELEFSVRRNSKVLKKIEEFLAQTILVFYKSNYIYEHICIPCGIEQYKDILAKSLAVFDRKSEIEEIENLIDVSDTLYVESFYVFKLKAFRARWDEICNLFLENLASMQLSETFNELLSYLIISTESGRDEVYIHETEKQIYITTKNGDNLIEPIERSVNYIMQVVSELIVMAPKNIVIKKSGESDICLLQTLVQLFQEKVLVNA